MTTQKKIALVLGASRGIGKQIALDLAKKDYVLILNARDTEALYKVYRNYSART